MSKSPKGSISNEVKRKTMEKGGTVSDIGKPSTATGRRSLRLDAYEKGKGNEVKRADSNDHKKTVHGKKLRGEKLRAA